MNKTSFIPAVLAGATVALVAQAMPAAAASFNLTSSFVTGVDYSIDSQFNILLEDYAPGSLIFLAFSHLAERCMQRLEAYLPDCLHELMENTQDMLLVNSLIEGCKPYSAVAILKSHSEMSEPGVMV